MVNARRLFVVKWSKYPRSHVAECYSHGNRWLTAKSLAAGKIKRNLLQKRARRGAMCGVWRRVSKRVIQ